MPPNEDLSSTVHDYLRSVSAGGRPDASVRVRLEVAAALYKSSRFEMAETIYRSVLQNRPGSYRALLNMGYLARRRAYHAAALAYFQAAFAAKPQRARPKLDAATELRKLSRLEESETLFRSVLAHQPKHVRALAGLGRIAQARGNSRLALNCYRGAVAANPARTDLALRVATQLR